MPGSKPTPDPVVDHGQKPVNPAAAPPAVPWQPPIPADPANPWNTIPLNADGTPNWGAIAPGYPNGPWDPYNPQPGPNGRTITFSAGPPAILTINCGGGCYQIPWANLCNSDAPTAVAEPTGHCEERSQPFTSVTVVVAPKK